VPLTGSTKVIKIVKIKIARKKQLKKPITFLIQTRGINILAFIRSRNLKTKKFPFLLMIAGLILLILVSGSGCVFAGQDVNITLAISSTEIPQNEYISIEGTLSVPESGPIILQWGINGSGFIANYHANMTQGQYSRNFGFAGPGEWTFRIIWEGNEQYNSVTSNVINVKVLPVVEDETDYTIYILSIGVLLVVVILGFFLYSKRKKTNNPREAKNPQKV
jgi:hypothetical protein